MFQKKKAADTAKARTKSSLRIKTKQETKKADITRWRNQHAYKSSQTRKKLLEKFTNQNSKNCHLLEVVDPSQIET